MHEPTAKPDPVEVFISYSFKDEKLKEELEDHLTSLIEEGVIEKWHGRMIGPGEDWEKEIDAHINRADIILLLVSRNFMASRYCTKVEFKRAAERAEAGEAVVIPVILHSTDWEHSPLGPFQALPDDGRPVIRWRFRDDAFLNVVTGIRKAAERLAATLGRVKDRLRERGSARPDYTAIEFEINRPFEGFDRGEFKAALHEKFGVNIERIRIVSVRPGSVRVTIEGDDEELARIVESLQTPGRRLREFEEITGLGSVSYFKGAQGYTLTIERPSLAGVLREAMRAVPAVKYALGVAIVAAAVAIVASFSASYKVAVFGTVTMFVLMFTLVEFSWFARYAKASIKPLALTLAWTSVLLICGTAFFIFTGFFFSWPQPLEAYVESAPRPTPPPPPAVSPTPTPALIAQASPPVSPTVSPPAHAAVHITVIPPYDLVGGPNSEALIAGKVSGVSPNDYRIVIYSLTLTTWYVEPTEAEPLTKIEPDGTWKTEIHTGIKYVALLVPPDYNPPGRTSMEPTRLGGVVASAEVEGRK